MKIQDKPRVGMPTYILLNDSNVTTTIYKPYLLNEIYCTFCFCLQFVVEHFNIHSF